jgi:hypothetical protein
VAYATLVHENVLRRICPHLHGSIAEAWACALKERAHWGVSGVTVVGALMGQDGVPRHRDLTADEQDELDALRG